MVQGQALDWSLLHTSRKRLTLTRWEHSWNRRSSMIAWLYNCLRLPDNAGNSRGAAK